MQGLSVTQRIKTISQPKMGYVPCSLFEIQTYEDYYETFDIRSDLSSIQGLAVDYLTRYMITKDKFTAFDIPIAGAKAIDDAYENNAETNRIGNLLKQVNGLDDKSIIAVCKIVCYDSAFRKGIEAYKDFETVEFSNELFHNIPILVGRCISFFESIGGIVSTELTFEGGYTSMISSGDGDYLSSDMIIDVKVSKNEISIKWSLQLLMYYLMGFHSIHDEYKQIKHLCIFNPLKNMSYICNIDNISDESKYKVSHDVIGYKMVNNCFYFDDNWNPLYDYSKWQDVNGSDNTVLKSFLTSIFTKTDFDISQYGDGIFDITVDDYWTYLQTFDEYRNGIKPLFRNTQSVKFIKHSGYFMFVSVSHKGKYSLLHGARLHSLKYSLEYYYDFLEKYANGIILKFSKYWDALRKVSEQIKSLEPTEAYLRQQYSEYVALFNNNISFDEWYKERGHDCKLNGRIHGCIVDIDYHNHIYINPLDGSITPYCAISMYDKNVYRNVKSLLSAQRPEMLPSFNELAKKQNNTSLMIQNSKTTNLSIITETDEISMDFIKVYEHDMYAVSNKLKPLQNIYDFKWVQIWYENILKNHLQLEDKYIAKKKSVKNSSTKASLHIGEVFLQKNGMNVTITFYKNYNNVDVRFEDGIEVEHLRMDTIKSGNVKHPELDKPKEKEQVQKSSVKDKYIGIERMMNCGLKAVCIDYIDCKHVTIKFEDGLIRKDIRSDHFNAGKVKHEGGYYEQ